MNSVVPGGKTGIPREPAGHGHAVHRARRGHAGDAPHRFDHRFLFLERHVASRLHQARSISASITPCGWKPSGACSMRTMPRTATSEAVTSSMQMAICAPNKKIPQGKPAQGHRLRRSALHRLQRTALPRLPRRNHPKEQRAHEGEGQSRQVDARVHADGQLAIGRLPPVQRAQQAGPRSPAPLLRPAPTPPTPRSSIAAPAATGSLRGPPGAPVPGCDPPRARQTGWPDWRMPPPAPAEPAQSRRKEIRE